jgi:hypothetical protein
MRLDNIFLYIFCFVALGIVTHTHILGLNKIADIIDGTNNNQRHQKQQQMANNR